MVHLRTHSLDTRHWSFLNDVADRRMVFEANTLDASVGLGMGKRLLLAAAIFMALKIS